MAGDKSTPKDKPKTEIEWSVIDSNAYPTASNKSGHREHLTRDRTPYLLHHKKAAAMPMRHAIDFLCDPAFKVFDDKGELVPFIKPAGPEVAMPRLAAGQVVASVAELSDQALLVRAKRINPLATKDIGRAALIKLITDGEDDGPEAGEGGETGEDQGAEAELAEDE